MKYNLSAYYFTGNAHDLPQLPHGNSKRGTPYKQTKKSALERPKAVCKNNLPSAACAIVEKETGGIVNADSSGSLHAEGSRHVTNYDTFMIDYLIQF